MKINKSYLERFVKKASLNGNISTINLDFNEEGISSSSKDSANIALPITTLTKEKFTDYKQLGELYIKNSTFLLNTIKGFKDEISIEKIDEYVLKLFDGFREAFIILGADIVCENVHRKGLLEIPTTATVKLNKANLTTTINDLSKLGSMFTILDRKDDKFRIHIGEEKQSDWFIYNLDIEGEGEGLVKVGEYFIKTYSVLEGDFKVEFGNGVPVHIHESSDGIEFHCFIAPTPED